MSVGQREAAPRGVVLVCDDSGRIGEVLYDTLPLDTTPRAGAPLTELFDPGSRMKSQLLLDEIHKHGAAFGWELNASVDHSVLTLHVGGGATADGVFIVVSVSAGAVTRLYEQLMEINNEQANALRAVMKDHLHALSEGAHRDAELYAQITRLNGDLANEQRQLAKANTELQALVKQRDELLGMAAHDLRNPLGVILNFSQFLLDDAGPELRPEHREFLASIQAQSRFMLDLVNELLDISKIEAGKLELNPLRIDPVSFVERNVAMNRHLARKKLMELRFEHGEDVPELEMDPVRMDQVINNLVSNAIKYSHGGSTAVVRVERDGDGGVRITVTDEGVGIRKEHLERLFRPFGRVATEGTAGEASTGLGLAIARKIVEAHRGRLSVTSEVGRGSTFAVWLPAW